MSHVNISNSVPTIKQIWLLLIDLFDWFDTGSHRMIHEELHIDNSKDYT